MRYKNKLISKGLRREFCLPGADYWEDTGWEELSSGYHILIRWIKSLGVLVAERKTEDSGIELYISQS